MAKKATEFDLAAELKSIGVKIQHGFEEVDRIDTGILTLDLVLGGGLPLGRMTTIWGKEQTGKSTMAAIIAAYVSRQEKKVAYIDAEGTMDPGYTAQFGDPGNIDVIYPTYMEQAGNAVKALLQSRKYDLVIWDSLVSMPPLVVAEADLEDNQMARSSLVLTKHMQQVNGLLRASNTAYLVINQARKNFAQNGAEFIQAAGQAVKHHAAIEIQMFTAETQYVGTGENREAVSYIHKGRTDKNKTAPRYQRFEFEILVQPEPAFNIARDTLDAGVARQVIEKIGGNHKFQGESFAPSGEKAELYLNEHPEEMLVIRQAIRSTYGQGFNQGDSDLLSGGAGAEVPEDGPEHEPVADFGD